MTLKRTWTLALLAAALAVTVASSSLVHGKGKPPKGDPPPPDPPPIEFHLTMLPSNLGNELRISRMNYNGDIVGGYYIGGVVASENSSTFVYLASTRMLYDLHDFLPADSDWFLDSADDINDSGQIVGDGYTGTDGERHAYRFTPSDGTNPATIEDFSDVDLDHMWSSANAINNNGEFCMKVRRADGSYSYFIIDAEGYIDHQMNLSGPHQLRDINDSRQVACRNMTDYYDFRYTPGTGEDTFPNPWGVPMGNRRLNNSGQVIGETGFRRGNGKKVSVAAGRHTDGVGIEDIGMDGGIYTSGGGWSINNAGDCAASDNNYEGRFYLDSKGITFSIRDAVTTADSDDALQQWQNAPGIYVRDINDEQQVCGYITNPDGSRGNLFLLTPIPE